MKLNDCPHCGLPIPMCSCSNPDAVYYEPVSARLDVRLEREKSPQEGMSDYDKSKVFVDEFLFGREGKDLRSVI